MIDFFANPTFDSVMDILQALLILYLWWKVDSLEDKIK